jgi:hypothetical protein
MSPKERATGIEPVSLTWKAKALPLSNARSNSWHYTISEGLYNNLRQASYEGHPGKSTVLLQASAMD